MADWVRITRITKETQVCPQVSNTPGDALEMAISRPERWVDPQVSYEVVMLKPVAD